MQNIVKVYNNTQEIHMGSVPFWFYPGCLDNIKDLL